MKVLWDWTGVTLTVFRDHYGGMLGTILGVVRGHFEGNIDVLQVVPWGHSGGDIGSTLGLL